MKVIFLDIDGVLNSTYYTKHRIHGYIGLEARCVALYFKLKQTTGAETVLSSSWRHLEIMMEGLNQYDPPITWIDTTPRLPSVPRGEEIDHWLVRHPDVKRYVILDDKSDMLKHQRRFFVQTSPVHGLREKDVKKAVQILNDPLLDPIQNNCKYGFVLPDRCRYTRHLGCDCGAYPPIEQPLPRTGEPC